MCLPAIENIKIKNNLNKDITISSIFTDSIELNTGLSFKQKIASHSYLNLSIVFSARTLGILSRRMTIHTDVGSFNYDVYFSFCSFFLKKTYFIRFVRFKL